MPREALAHHPVILTKVRTQSHEEQAFVALGPDFRQDDGAWLVASDANV
ncbi:hypothetical protein C8J25_104213 [Sphingomonas faeni]|uniref:Uncharacterized protein n=1 Tax=Sphingomonas faeni TaxID=185950 RepID=A0A2T5U5T2_9SPHN|nr:hypothetical protein C8J25_104213 [Sphingomonas faeni]